MDYGSYYQRNVEPFFATRRQLYADIIAEQVAELQADARRPLRILDIGAGSGKLMRAVFDRLGDHTRLQVVAVEPDPSFQGALAQQFKLEMRTEQVVLVESTIQDFLPDARAQFFDLCLQVDTLYHYLEDLEDICEGIARLLHPDGRGLAFFAGGRGTLSSLKRRFSAELSRCSKRPAVGGGRQHLSQVAEVLARLPSIVSTFEDDRLIDFEADVSSEFRREFQEGLARERADQKPRLVWFLAFLLRIEPGELVSSPGLMAALEKIVSDTAPFLCSARGLLIRPAGR